MPSATALDASPRGESGLPISLADVARLARVRRPVVSVWRTRFASGEGAFPAPLPTTAAGVQFDAVEVAEWLIRTDHGNNPDARADVALWATPDGLALDDAEAVDELSALIALHAEVGVLGGMTPRDLEAAASRHDPADTRLRREIEAHAGRSTSWARYVDRLMDATYGPVDAWGIVAERSRRMMRAGSELAPGVAALSVDLVAELVRRGASPAAAVVVHGTPASLTVLLGTRLGAEVSLATADTDGDEVRRARRRLLLDGIDLPLHRSADRAVHLVSTDAGPHAAERALTRIDDIVLSLGPEDAAVVVGSARLLTQPLPPAADRRRSDLLRTGRVRTIALLPTGLVECAPREALAIWVLAAPTGTVPLDQRHTMIADLTDAELTDAARGDLVSDVWASLGSARQLRGRAFRYGRFVRTARLLASEGPLITPVARSSSLEPSTIPALLDAAARDLPAHVSPLPTRPTDLLGAPLATMTIAELTDHGHARVLSGTRLDPALVGESGLVVVGVEELGNPTSLGRRRVAQLAFAAAHPRVALTRPGDVVFRTAPTPAAWVDAGGSSVVAYPARVLRITTSDPGGLVPEVVAADIRAATSSSWRRWVLRRVAPLAAVPLQRAITQLHSSRRELLDAVAQLDRYTELLTAGVVAGTVTVMTGSAPADTAAETATSLADAVTSASSRSHR